MRFLLTILLVVLVLSVLGLIPVLYVRGQEPMMQRPLEGGTFGIILNDRVYSLDGRPTRQVIPYYPEYSPWQRYDSYRQFNRYDFNRSYRPQYDSYRQFNQFDFNRSYRPRYSPYSRQWRYR